MKALIILLVLLISGCQSEQIEPEPIVPAAATAEIEEREDDIGDLDRDFLDEALDDLSQLE